MSSSGPHTRWVIVKYMLISLVLGGEILNVCKYHIVNYVFGSLCMGPVKDCQAWREARW